MTLPFPYSVVSSAQRRSTMAARVKSRESELYLEVRVPSRTSSSTVMRFLEQNQEKLQQLFTLYRQHNPTPPPIVPGLQLQLLGSGITLKVVVLPHRKVIKSELDSVEKVLWLYVPRSTNPSQLRKGILKWYWEYARQFLTERTNYWSNQMGISYNYIRIKDMRTRWGSCSSQGNLNYKWQIVMAPVEIIDYLVIHELAHRKQANHSAAFWAIVKQYDEQYNAHRIWLRKKGSQLVL